MIQSSYEVGFLSKVMIEEFKPAGVKIATTDAEAKTMAETQEDDHDAKVTALTSALPSPSSVTLRLSPVDFEKDDDKHMMFVTAASNLRARNYQITEASLHETRGIAGKIIPAIATTTALVTGLVCFEYYKLLQNKPIESYRNFSANLAIPILSCAEPVAPARTTTKLKTGEWAFSLWDRIDLDIGDVTLQQLIDLFSEKYGLELNMLSYGAAMLYYSFSMPKKKAAERLASKLTDLVKNVAKQELLPKQRYLILEGQVTSIESGEDVDIPYIRLKFR